MNCDHSFGLSTLNFHDYYSHYYFKMFEHLQAWQVFPAARDMTSLSPVLYFPDSQFRNVCHPIDSTQVFPFITADFCFPHQSTLFFIRSVQPYHFTCNIFLKARLNRWKEQNAASKKHRGYLFIFSPPSFPCFSIFWRHHAAFVWLQGRRVLWQILASIWASVAQFNFN